MTREELIEALEGLGLTVTVRSGDGLKVSRPGGLALLAETITFTDGRAYWSWGHPIDGDDAEAVAGRIDRIVSTPPRVVRNSA